MYVLDIVAPTWHWKVLSLEITTGCTDSYLQIASLWLYKPSKVPCQALQSLIALYFLIRTLYILIGALHIQIKALYICSVVLHILIRVWHTHITALYFLIGFLSDMNTLTTAIISASLEASLESVAPHC